jgi:tRNA_anti-like
MIPALRIARRLLVVAASALIATSTLACVDQLPEQDLRILSTPPAARLSADLLWEDYRTNREQADRTYRGKAIVVTGTVTAAGAGEPGQRYVVFGRAAGGGGVRASLLDEQASAILASAKEQPKLTIKCFCEGVTDYVILKSCVAP